MKKWMVAAALCVVVSVIADTQTEKLIPKELTLDRIAGLGGILLSEGYLNKFDLTLTDAVVDRVFASEEVVSSHVGFWLPKLAAVVSFRGSINHYIQSVELALTAEQYAGIRGVLKEYPFLSTFGKGVLVTIKHVAIRKTDEFSAFIQGRPVAMYLSPVDGFDVVVVGNEDGSPLVSSTQQTQ